LIIKKFKWLAFFFITIVSAFVCLIEFPSFLYPYKHVNKNVIIYSDKAFPKNVKEITDEVLFRLKKSELYKSDEIYRVHAPTEYWRWGLVSLPINYQNIGGFCMGFRRNVFLRPSDIANNKLTFPGVVLADAQERDLIYFITHEIGHALVYDEVGYISNFTDLPRWLSDGYPDYIAKKSFDFESNLKQFKDNEWRLTEDSGLYVRYHLLVSFLIDQNGYSIRDVFQKIPEKKELINTLQSYTFKNNTNKFVVKETQ
jgi:hypothetical protein